MNSPIKEVILLNTNNAGPSMLPGTTDSITLDGNFSSTGMTITLYQLDKSAYDSRKTTSVLHVFSGAIMTTTGTLMSNGNFDSTGTPFALNIGLSDYVMILENSGNTPISYDIGATALGKSVYIIPLDDSVSPKTLLVPDYRYYDGEFIYRSKVMRE